MEIARDLEFCKQELVLHAEYNVADCYQAVSKQSDLTQARFLDLLSDLGQLNGQNKNEFISIFNEFDLDKDRKLNIAEWSQLLTPL